MNEWYMNGVLTDIVSFFFQHIISMNGLWLLAFGFWLTSK